jgi:hypothetical protein
MGVVTSQEILQSGLDTLRAAIIQRSTEAGQKSSGRSYERIRTQNVTFTHGELVGPTWIGVWEDGRKPGKVPYDFYEIIMEWATFKGISWASADPDTFERWARGVAWYIREHGTKLYRSGQKMDIFTTPVADFEAWLIGQLKTYYAARVSDEIRTAWKNNK